MAGRPQVLIVHNRVAPGAPPHEADVLVQVEAVRDALRALDHDCVRLEANLDLGRLQAELAARRPGVVFNLVECLDGSDRLAPLVPALLERIGQPFTGATAEGLFLTMKKPVAKQWLRAHGIATPDCWEGGAPPADEAQVRWIVKSETEEASCGLDDAAVVTGLAAAAARMAVSRARHGGEWFAERFVDGREFNVAVLAGPDGPVVLPPAEIEFRDFPAGKPRIVGYSAKWEETSFEGRNTVRRFLDERAESGLARDLGALAARCWQVFGLRGWARVDLRVDDAGRPWVLEVNANPCLAPDAGFAAAVARAGLSFEGAVARILADAWRPAGGTHG